jgi:phosphoglycolate phosphatase
MGFDARSVDAVRTRPPVKHHLFIFDLDGTLVDSLPDIAAALNHALASLHRPPLPLSVVQTCVGEGIRRLAEKALLAFERIAEPQAVQALTDAIRAFYRAHPCVHTQLYPGIADLLRALRAEPARRIAVLTNKPGEVTRDLLAALDLATAFDAVIGDGDGYPRKPDPAAARALIARFSLDPTRTLLIGDGIPDLQVARAVPCASAAALWGYTPRATLQALSPTYTLESPSDLLPHL